MVTCAICGKEYKSITPTHLSHKHNTTIKKYQERFPNAEIYASMRYEKLIQRPFEDFGDVPLEVGLEALRRYGPVIDKDPKLPRVIQISIWSKITRERLEKLFA